MKNITRSDGEFSQRMIDRHARLRRSTTDFALVTSAKRIVPRRRWLELVYAMPNMVLRREILRSVSMTRNILTSSASPIWNILVRLYRIFPYARSVRKPAMAGMKTELIFSQSAVPVKWRGVLPNIWGSDIVYHPGWHSERENLQKGQRTVSHSKPALMETALIMAEMASASTASQSHRGGITHLSSSHPFKPAFVLSRTADSGSVPIKSEFTSKPSATGIITHLSGSHSFKPTFSVNRKTVHNRETNIVHPESAPIEMGSITHLSGSHSLKPEFVLSRTADSELAPIKSEFTTQPPATGVITHLSGSHLFNRKTVHNRETNIAYPESSPILLSPPTIIHKPPGINTAKNPTQEIHSSSSYFTFMDNDRMRTNTQWTETAPIYHTRPEIEYARSTRTEVITERVVEREIDSRLPDTTPKSAAVDINRLAEQVYSSIERRLMIEKERRGLYG